MQLCRAIIFTVGQDKLVHTKTRQSNYEFAHMVYSNEQEASKSISHMTLSSK
jgi:carboxypeptidase C (cathepsin A)